MQNHPPVPANKVHWSSCRAGQEQSACKVVMSAAPDMRCCSTTVLLGSLRMAGKEGPHLPEPRSARGKDCCVFAPSAANTVGGGTKSSEEALGSIGFLAGMDPP